jgi:hypothetical protein
MVAFSSTVRQPASFCSFQLGANCERMGRVWDHGRRLTEEVETHASHFHFPFNPEAFD